MERSLSPLIKKDADRKIVLISGPRQSGKTTLAKRLFPSFDYLNYDDSDDRNAIQNKYWRRDADVILFDELHKMPEWKRWLKGVYDTEGNRPRLLVTGSANLETFRKVGDSLAGRYFPYRLHPIDLKEGVTFWKDAPSEVFQRLMNCSGFPEPFLEGDVEFYKRWQRSHLDVMLRQDFLDLYAVRSLRRIELLVNLLRDRVASTISYENLKGDLGADAKSIKQWLEMLENIYTIFRVTPYHHNIARSLLKEPKFYFYDIPRVPNEGARLENLVACSLLKAIHYTEDVHGHKGRLHYLRTKDGNEIDFLVVLDDRPILCIEVKSSDSTPSKNFAYYKNYLGNIRYVQLVLNLSREFDTPDGIQVRDLITFLATLTLS